MVELIIPGNPCAKGRPRWSRHGTYTPEKTVAYETLIKELFVIKYPNFKPLERSLSLNMIAQFSVPKSASKKKRAEMLAGKIRPSGRPDIDNIIKIFADALSGLAYRDDSQIATVSARKVYGETSQVWITISENGIEKLLSGLAYSDDIRQKR